MYMSYDQNVHSGFFFIGSFSSELKAVRLTKPFSTKFDIKQSSVTGIRVSSNEGPFLDTF